MQVFRVRLTLASTNENNVTLLQRSEVSKTGASQMDEVPADGVGEA